MKITIYVKYEHLENMHKFLSGKEHDSIEWYHDRPGMGRFIIITIDYSDFVNLDDK